LGALAPNKGFGFKGYGTRLAFIGGYWSGGAYAGFSYWNLNNSSGNTNINIGRQTLISVNKRILRPIFLTAWWKLSRKEQGLVGLLETP
jgi:hypothetical protein